MSTCSPAPPTRSSSTTQIARVIRVGCRGAEVRVGSGAVSTLYVHGVCISTRAFERASTAREADTRHRSTPGRRVCASKIHNNCHEESIRRVLFAACRRLSGGRLNGRARRHFKTALCVREFKHIKQPKTIAHSRAADRPESVHNSGTAPVSLSMHDTEVYLCVVY